MNDALVANTGESEQIKFVWCIDSGLSDHLTNRKDLFTEYMVLKVPKVIASAKSGVTLKATGIGNIRVKCFVGQRYAECTIKNVYYVPEFEEKFIMCFQTGKSWFKSDNEWSLYTIEMELDNSNCNFVSNDDEGIQLWHRRFGHLGLRNLNIWSNKNLVDSLNDLKHLNNQ